ncbi:MAG: hypothetical protein ABSB42_14255 [Tepidisphaeraceae bacterium]|jgi:hypothetical protein
MTLDEARKIIRDRSASYPLHVEAAAVLASSKQSEIGDLIRCLRLGGLPAETAATSLYTRTGRPYNGNIAEFSTDAEEWSRYLARQLEVAN